MLRCSHIVCKVDDLSKTVEDYRALGFNIHWGSEPERAHNALLWFETGPFIEFYQPPKLLKYLVPLISIVGGRPMGKRFRSYLGMTAGWCDIAFEPDSHDETRVDENNGNYLGLKRVRTVFKESGIATSRIIKGSRVRPDQKKVKFSAFIPDVTGWPFVMSGYDFPQRPATVDHPNGAKEVVSFTVGVLEKDLPRFNALYGGEALLKPRAADTPGITRVEISGPEIEFDPARLHGANIVGVEI